MPLLTQDQAEIGVVLFTLFWGIIVETHFVGRWTIIFNVVPLLVFLSTVDMTELLQYVLIGYAIASIVVAVWGKRFFGNHKREYNVTKQLFGAKGYGSLSASILIIQQQNNNPDFDLMTLVLWIGIAIPTYALWYRYNRWHTKKK